MESPNARSHGCRPARETSDGLARRALFKDGAFRFNFSSALGRARRTPASWRECFPSPRYEQAIGAKTALIPKVHTITMRFKAFTAQVSETEQSSRADSRNSTANRSIGLLGVMWYLFETSRIGDGLER